MKNSKQTTEKPASEQAVLKALASEPEATAADVATAANVGRSTAGKVLARLTNSGGVRRTPGGRDGARRLPDRFALASAEPAADGAKPKAAADAEPKADAKPKAADDAKPKAAGERLRPGALDGLVLSYMTSHKDTGPFGPGMIAKALGHSAGAVSNCITRLTKAKQVRQVSESPRRYSLASSATRERAPHSPPGRGGDEGSSQRKDQPARSPGGPMRGSLRVLRCG
jgi:hypothetical protein